MEDGDDGSRHDDHVANLMAVASPEEKLYKSKIDDILFPEGSPPSPPALETFKKSPSSLVKRILEQNSSHNRAESPPSGGSADEGPPKLPGTPPPKPARTVKFNMADSPSASSNLDEASEESLLDRLTRTQEKLTQTQIDLSGEKALRKRKDKNLVKLAKELQKRAAILETKDQQVVKVSQKIKWKVCCENELQPELFV